MEIKFNWLPKINPSLMEEAEEKIKIDIKDFDHLKTCHASAVSVSISSTDPLEVSIKGNITCQCGNVIASFTGASDGSKMNYNILN